MTDHPEPAHDDYAKLIPDPPPPMDSEESRQFEAEMHRLENDSSSTTEDEPSLTTDDVEWLARGGDLDDQAALEWSRLRYHDVDNATRYTLLHGDRVRYVHAWGKWLHWTGTRWRLDNRAGVLALEKAKQIPRELYRRAADLSPDEAQAAAKAAGQLAAKSRLQAAVDLARGTPGILVDHDDLDADPWALCVQNGWLDLRTGTFHSPEPDKLMTLQAGTVWDPDAAAPEWGRCLAEWMPDADLRDFFHRLCGASLVGQVKDHMLVIVHGRGGNGKRTALGTIADVLGDYFIVPHKSLLVAQRHEPHDTVKASLFRVRMAMAAESDARRRLNEASVKELTGGDLLRARRLYEDEWSFTPSHTLWLQTNYLPEITGRDRGIWRRIRVLPWTSVFAGAAEDRDLAEKLWAEAPGILRWLVEGVARWQETGLGDNTVPRIVAEATAEYRESEDVVGRWAKETGLSFHAELTTGAKELTESWKAWTEGEFGRARRFNDVAAWLEENDCHREGPYRTMEGGRRVTKTIWKGVGWGEPGPDLEEAAATVQAELDAEEVLPLPDAPPPEAEDESPIPF